MNSERKRANRQPEEFESNVRNQEMKTYREMTPF